MGDSSSNHSSAWQGSGSRVNPGHLVYQQSGEDEPSSSIPSSSSSSSGDYVSVSSASFVPSSYRGPGVFSNTDRYPADSYDVQGTSVSGHLYQAAESSYQGEQEAQQDQFADMSAAGNEAEIQMYDNMDNDSNNYDSVQSIASSSVCDQTGYPMHQLIVDAQNRIVAVQRVISPDVDSTVSQSANGVLHRRIAETASSGQRSLLMQPSTSGTSLLNMHHAQSEVTTSGESLPHVNISHHRGDSEIGHGHGEVEVAQSTSLNHGARQSLDVMESAVSSITGSVSNEAEVIHRVTLKTEQRSIDDIVCGEPDTTQTDVEEEFGSMDKDFDEDSSSIDNRDDLSSNMLPLDNVPHPSSSNNLVDSTQMITMRLPIATSSAAANQIPVSNLSSNQIPVSTLSFNQIPVSNLSSNQIPASTLSANQIPVSTLSSDQIPISNLSANQIPVSSLSTSFLGVNITNEYPDELQNTHPVHLAVNDMPMPSNQLARSASQLVSSMESPLSPTTYMLEDSSVATSTKLEPSDFSSQVSTYMSSRGMRLDSTNIDSPVPGTSMHTVQSRNFRRKSSRIADLDNESPVWRKPEYESRPYNPCQLWCEECMRSYDSECPVHKQIPLQDKTVFSRAWASLPQALQIFRLNEDNTELGVFSKRAINKRTQFGPFVAEFVDSVDRVTNNKFPLMVDRDGTNLFYETSDENRCNWMMFVRPAETYAEQNMVAYQYENDIYFTVTKDISEPRTELKVWYAAHYAERWNKQCHKATEQDLQAMEEQLCKFHCYECPKRFKSASALQKHLIAHDSDKNSAIEEPTSSQLMPPPRQRKKKSFPPQAGIRKKLLAAKKAKEAGSAEGMSMSSSSGIFHWKKRSTNIYLNKTLKKYQKWHNAENVRKSVQSQLAARYDVSDDSISELECESCDLAFSNSTLLSLHTLSHNEADHEDNKFSLQLEPLVNQMPGTAPQVQVGCPGCSRQFYQKTDLIHHVAEHGAPKSTSNFNLDYHADIMSIINSGPHRQHRCGVCFKSFTTIDRLAKHHQCHGDEANKPLQCHVCFKRFINNSALSCHMKTHSTAKYYQCPICHIGFDQSSAMREHSLIHANQNGTFNCPHCDKVFLEFLVLKKHVRGFHTNRTYPCNVCDKVFPRADKLRLHMLRHSTIREFMCDTCGRQFKRKDKLKEHIKRMHSIDRVEKDRMKALKPHIKRFTPKVAPTEYHRFIYKCHLCLLGFKRRGMLVNHIAKRHPDLKPESVPELNLPILKTQRDYYCQYCDKVYKSSSKRKAHILKNHPGSDLPQSARKKINIDEIPGVPNPTYSQTVGSITTMPHQCEHCHKQYASKAKLLQHQRKHHPDLAPLLDNRLKREALQHIPQNVGQVSESTAAYVVERCDDVQDPQTADLLTQAMSELTQSVEFRQISGTPGSEQAFLTTRLGNGTPTMVHIQTSSGQGAQTIELANLSQALQHFAPPQGHMPIQVQVSNGVPSQIQIPITTSQAGSSSTATHIVTVDPQSSEGTAQQSSSPAQQQLNFPPISIVSGAYIPKSWTNYTYKSH